MFAVALDISKAFDKVCHKQTGLLFKHYKVAGVPTWIILVISNWYSKLHVVVRWIDDVVSEIFCVNSGLRQCYLMLLLIALLYV